MTVFVPRAATTRTGLLLALRSPGMDDAAAMHTYRRVLLRAGIGKVKQAAEFTASVADYGRKLQASRDNPLNLWLLAEHDGQVVGSLDFHRSPWQRLRHHGSFGMSVHPDFQGRGVGRCLLQTLIDWTTPQPDIEAIRLGVFAANTRAHSLYAKLGFTEEGRRHRAIKYDDGTCDDEILMVLHRHSTAAT